MLTREEALVAVSVLSAVLMSKLLLDVSKEIDKFLEREK